MKIFLGSVSVDTKTELKASRRIRRIMFNERKMVAGSRVGREPPDHEEM